ncbi:MAG: hypothetical protein ACYST5_00230 [Planctomycetota bacterium]
MWIPDTVNALTAKDISEIVVNVSTFIAIVIGGVWTYMMFVRRRQKYPRAKVSHRIIHKKIDNNKTLIRVDVEMCNQGDVLIRLSRRLVRIKQMLPLGESALQMIDSKKKRIRRKEAKGQWPILGEVDLSGEDAIYEIEPGDTDEFPFDFVISSEVKTVIVYSYFRNKAKRGREIGWNKRTVYDIFEKEGVTMSCEEKEGPLEEPMEPQEPQEEPQEKPTGEPEPPMPPMPCEGPPDD